MSAERSIIHGKPRQVAQHQLANLGGAVWRQWRELRHTAAVTGS
jgi:hypothetical protein